MDCRDPRLDRCHEPGAGSIHGRAHRQGSKGSRIVPGPGASAASTPGATPTNPGGLGTSLHDVRAVPYTESGLPRALGGKPKAASESAGKADTDGLHGRERRGTGGATLDQTRIPNAKGSPSVGSVLGRDLFQVESIPPDLMRRALGPVLTRLVRAGGGQIVRAPPFLLRL